MKIWSVLILSGLLVCPGMTKGQAPGRSEILKAAKLHFPKALEEYRAFLGIPNDGHFPEQMQNNVNWCVKALENRRFDARVIFSKGVPHVFGQRMFDPEKPSVLFYLQIDGQPVDPLHWHQEDPFKPVLKEYKNGAWQIIEWDRLKHYDPDWRIFARSASDSKGPAMAFLTALDVIIAQDIEPDFNIKVIMDFQEEMGSPTLPQLVIDNKALFEAEMLLIMDGTRHISNLPTLTFGARGIATITLKAFGARRGLHSGQYGNFAPNPVFHISRLIGSLKDNSGRVTIPGFYDGVMLTEKDKSMLAEVPENLDEIKSSLGIAEIDKVGSSYQEALQYPSLNVRGMSAAWVGEGVRTIIPAEVTVEIDLRLVPESDGQRQVDLIRNYIAEFGYHFVDSIPTESERMTYDKLISFDYRLGSKPFRTEMNSPIGDWLGKMMDRIFGPGNYVRMRTTGGSQPIAPFINTLGVPAVSIRIPNPDNSIHAPNENLRLGNFLEGIQMCLGILTQKME